MSKRRIKRAFSLLLALLLLLPFASCSNAPAEEAETPKEDVRPGVTEVEETDSKTPNWDKVEKPDLGGISIDIIQCPPSANYYDALDWDEMTGDKLSDAIYDRNRFVEGQLNMTLNVLKEDGAGNKLMQSAIAGSGDYDLGFDLIQSYGGGLLQKGLLRSYNTIRTIDLTEPWWDQAALETTTVKGQSFFGLLDFSFDMLESLTVLFYNGELITEYQLDDPYELFLEEKWTIDRMVAMMEVASVDVNNDGKYSIKTDSFGLAGREYWFQPMIFTSGLELVSWNDQDGQFVMHLGEERFITVAEAIGNIYVKGNPLVDYSDYDAGRIAFKEGRALFYSRLLGDYNNLRTNEDDYGVIGFPRYDYDYTGGESRYFVQNPDALFLPVVVGDDNGDGKGDYDEIGYFLQAVGSYSRDVTKEVYVENAVIGKGMRDQNSAEAVRYMMAHLGYDLNQYYGLTSILQGYGDSIMANANYASKAKALEKQFAKLTGKIVEAIEKAVEKQAEYMG
ncbi:MAG: extracellular solute-binding protein [Clostridia bacterium]|nr:extracellular solute-binding protein [Clostridia bacterium]